MILNKICIKDTFNNIIKLCEKYGYSYKIIEWPNGEINGIRLNGDFYIYTCDETGYEFSDKPTHFLFHYYSDIDKKIINYIAEYNQMDDEIKNMFCLEEN